MQILICFLVIFISMGCTTKSVQQTTDKPITSAQQCEESNNSRTPSSGMKCEDLFNNRPSIVYENRTTSPAPTGLKFNYKSPTAIYGHRALIEKPEGLGLPYLLMIEGGEAMQITADNKFLISKVVTDSNGKVSLLKYEGQKPIGYILEPDPILAAASNGRQIATMNLHYGIKIFGKKNKLASDTNLIPEEFIYPSTLFTHQWANKKGVDIALTDKFVFVTSKNGFGNKINLEMIDIETKRSAVLALEMPKASDFNRIYVEDNHLVIQTTEKETGKLTYSSLFNTNDLVIAKKQMTTASESNKSPTYLKFSDIDPGEYTFSLNKGEGLYFDKKKVVPESYTWFKNSDPKNKDAGWKKSEKGAEYTDTQGNKWTFRNTGWGKVETDSFGPQGGPKDFFEAFERNDPKAKAAMGEILDSTKPSLADLIAQAEPNENANANNAFILDRFEFKPYKSASLRNVKNMFEAIENNDPAANRDLLAISNGSIKVVTVVDDGFAKTYDMATGRKKYRITSTENGKAKVYDVSTGKEVTSAQLSPDGKALTLLENGKAKVYDVTTSKEVTCAQFSPDGNLLIPKIFTDENSSAKVKTFSWNKDGKEPKIEEGKIGYEVIRNGTKPEGSPRFAEVPPGRFKNSRGQDIEVSKGFSIMNAPLTQLQYALLLSAGGVKDARALAPSHFSESGTYSENVNVGGVQIRIQKNHPVERINYKETNELLQTINSLSVSDNETHQVLLNSIFPGHVKGKKYSLPTSAQYDWVAENLIADGKSLYSMVSNRDYNGLKEVFKTDENSPYGTQDVYSNRPMYLFGQPVFLVGNVFTRLQDKMSDTRVFRGGSWNMSKNMIGTGVFPTSDRTQFTIDEYRRDSIIGVLLVRD